jgi:hypothetical protein
VGRVTIAPAGPGHNCGPALQSAGGWHLHCWRRARADLLPHLPIEVVRLRVRRAAELGLDYRTYASVRAATGHDVLAFLFSSNALRVMGLQAALPPDRAERLRALVACGRQALATAPLAPQALLAATGGLIDAAAPAPHHLAGFGPARHAIRRALGPIPGDRVLLVGEGALEQDWCAAGGLAGWVPADRYFA